MDTFRFAPELFESRNDVITALAEEKGAVLRTGTELRAVARRTDGVTVQTSAGELRQEITAEDDRGETYRFYGEAIAAAPLPAWPNASFHDSVYRWEDEQGRVTHATYQEIWFADYQRAMLRRNTELARA